GIVTDELSVNLPFALGAAAALGLKRIELRGTSSGRVPFISDEEKELLEEMVDDYDFKITAISPGTFKCKLRSPQFKEQLKNFEEALNFAEEFEVPKIITFAVERSPEDVPDDYQTIIGALGEAALLAKKRGIIISAENEHGCWNDTPDSIIRLHNDLENTGLMLNWDPGNFHASCGLSYKTGYEPLKKYIANVHIKDSVGQDKMHNWVALGEGEIDWKSQIADIIRDMPEVDMSIETHTWPLLENTMTNLKLINEYIRSAHNG
ncbi:MAG: sugar phosphate isomerase/epimerase, partial [Eubacteriales bacterium]